MAAVGGLEYVGPVVVLVLVPVLSEAFARWWRRRGAARQAEEEEKNDEGPARTLSGAFVCWSGRS